MSVKGGTEERIHEASHTYIHTGCDSKKYKIHTSSTLCTGVCSITYVPGSTFVCTKKQGHTCARL
jgi:hypothetical protein